SVSPDFTTYVLSPPLVPLPGEPVAVRAVGAGTLSFCPIFKWLESTPGFASAIALVLTPYFFAMLEKLSPFTTTCWLALPVVGGADAIGVGSIGGCAVVTGGACVSICGDSVCEGGGTFIGVGWICATGGGGVTASGGG